MSYAYEIVPHRRLMYCRASGTLNELDTAVARQALQHDPRFDAESSIVIELLDLDVDSLTTNTIRQLIASFKFSASARRAVVAPEPSHHTFAKLFRIQSELSGTIEDVRLCRTLQEALDWVGSSTFRPTSLKEAV